jgi:predicted RNase H-like HicB family nuclease
MKARYHIHVFYSEEDKCYIADIPDLKYCSAHGATPEQAVREVLVAQEAWLESARAARKRPPEPKYRPAVYELA